MAANRVPLTREGLLGAWRMTSRTYEIVGTGERRRYTSSAAPLSISNAISRSHKPS